MTADLLAFLAAALVIVVVPGPDMMLLLRNAARAGRTGAAWTVAGILSALILIAAAAIAGLTALLAASPVLFTALRVAGGLYLVWLGVTALRSWWRLRRLPEAVADAASAATPPRAAGDLPAGTRTRCFRQGAVSNLLNPKVAAFFLSLFPQFDLSPLSPLAQHVALAAGFWGIALLWYLVVIAAIGRLGPLLSTPKVARRTEAVAGTALVGLGATVLAKGA